MHTVCANFGLNAHTHCAYFAKTHTHQRCKKAADLADRSVLFFTVGANFWASTQKADAQIAITLLLVLNN